MLALRHAHIYAGRLAAWLVLLNAPRVHAQGEVATPDSSGPGNRKIAGVQATGYAQRAFGASLSFTPPRDNDSGTPGPSGQIAQSGRAWLAMGPMAARYADQLSFGRDRAGWNYQLALSLAIGPRLKLTRDHFAFARLGAQAQLSRLGGRALSEITLPMAEVGYQYMATGRLLDLGLHAAPVVAGLAKTDAFRAPRKGAALGASVGMLLVPFWTSFDATIYPGAASRPLIWTAQSRLCLLLGSYRPTPTRRTGDLSRAPVVGKNEVGYRASLCSFSDVWAAKSRGIQPHGAELVYNAGVSIWIGKHSSLDPAR